MNVEKYLSIIHLPVAHRLRLLAEAGSGMVQTLASQKFNGVENLVDEKSIIVQPLNTQIPKA